MGVDVVVIRSSVMMGPLRRCIYGTQLWPEYGDVVRDRQRGNGLTGPSAAAYERYLWIIGFLSYMVSVLYILTIPH